MNKLVIVLSNLSRFDIANNKVLSGNAGNWFIYSLLGKSLYDKATVMVCQENSPLILPKDTTHCILLGDEAGRRIQRDNYKGLHSTRGTIFSRGGISFINTYQPQDAFDVKAEYEEENKLSVEEESTEEDVENEKDSTVTKRSNWRGWMTLDISKFVRAITNPREDIAYDISIRPMIMDVISLLESNQTLAIDIETTMEQEMTVIGFGFPDIKKVFVVPFYDYTGKRLYSAIELTCLYRAIYNRFQNSGTVIAHNAMFDFFVLAYKYHIEPPVVIEDTMLMQHRIFMELEKSLGHCISYWTNLPYHKDEGIFEPNNQEQQELFWMYNAKDIIGTLNVWFRQHEYNSTNRGTYDSCKQVNDCIPAYLHNTLLGILLDTEKTGKLVEKNTKTLEQTQRVLNALVGKDVKYLPSSSQSCAKYFHKILGYGVKKRSKGTGEPSVDEGSLYKIKLENPLNVVIDFSIRYRELQKINSIGKIELWQTPKEAFISQFKRTDALNTNASLQVDQSQNLLSKLPCNQVITPIHTGSLTDTSTNQDLSILSGQSPISTQVRNKIHLLIDRLTFQIPSSLSTIQLLHPIAPRKKRLNLKQRVTTGWKIGGTTTLRLSSAKLLGRWGTNLQNPNKQTLELFTVEDGYKIVQGDQAGAEALIVAHLCIDGKYRQLFRVGIKPHTYLALHLFPERWKPFGFEDSWLSMGFEELIRQEKWEAVKKAISEDDLYYYMAKQTCHSANYVVGAGTFCLSLLKNSGGIVNVSLAEGKRLLNTYYRIFPEIQMWHQEITETIKNTKTLKNLYGYPRQFFNINTEDGREMFAFKPQSTVGTLNNIAFTKLSYTASDKNWYVLNNKHDSVAMMVPDEEIHEGAVAIVSELEQDLVGRDGVKFKMKSEIQIGKNWGKYHETKNPGGMRNYSVGRKCFS